MNTSDKRVEHLTQGKTSPLSLCLTEAIEVAEAAKQSMVTEKQISVKKIRSLL